MSSIMHPLGNPGRDHAPLQGGAEVFRRLDAHADLAPDPIVAQANPRAIE